MFQSSPPLQGGRYGPSVSGISGGGWFQSSPPLQGGRYMRMNFWASTTPGFNPRPPCKGGATGKWEHYPGVCQRFQSSPPLQGGRYDAAGGSPSGNTGFNPRPPCKGGATMRRKTRAKGKGVSILAPLARGALPWRTRPPGWLCQFQSSPPLQGGRYSCLSSVCRFYGGFNPRPPCKGGATPN